LIDAAWSAEKIAETRGLYRLAAGCRFVHLPDVVVAVSVAAHSGKQRPVRRLTHVIIVKAVNPIGIAQVKANGNAFIMWLAVQRGFGGLERVIRIGNGQPAELRQCHGLNHRKTFLRAVRQVLGGFLTIQPVKHLPGRVAEIKNGLPSSD
jgi:hypothetical protein